MDVDLILPFTDGYLYLKLWIFTIPLLLSYGIIKNNFEDIVPLRCDQKVCNILL